MYSVQIIIFLMINSALRHINVVSSEIMCSSPDVFQIEMSQEQTTEQYVQAITNFWTDERLKAAKPKPMIQIDSLSQDKSINDRRTADSNKKPTTIQGTAPVSLKTLKRAGYPITVGKVFFVDGSAKYMCSASVVSSDNKDMIFTAGHCAFSTGHSRYVKNFVFIPQYENGTRPYGTWPARCLYTMSNWATGGTGMDKYNYDVAIALLYTVNGQHVQDVVGSQAVGFNYGHSATVYSFGYPANYYQGEIMTNCTATKVSADLPAYNGDKLSCKMGQGSSGGPWFESYNNATLLGIQTSVNSFMLTNVPGVMYGPHFGSAVQSLYEKANRNETCPSKANNSAFSMVIVLLSLILLQFL